jgi:hypothetical protein
MPPSNSNKQPDGKVKNNGKSGSATKTVPTPEIPPPPSDNKASKEALAIANDDYQGEGEKADHERQQRLKQAAHYAVIFVMVAWVLIYVSFVGVWAFHMLVPKAYRFLDANELNDIKSIVLSGAIAAVMGRYFSLDMLGGDEGPRKRKNR